jgi:homoserine kinase
MASIFEAALEVGALGVSLSGGGSSILALTDKDGEAIGEAMVAAAKKEGVSGKVMIAHPSLKGAHIVAID